MKEFRYAKGHKAGETMTVGELVEALSNYPNDMPVMAGWEGVCAYVDSANFEVVCVDKGHEGDQEECLVIDVENH